MQDSFSREAFTKRLNSNFSVIASAGSGKTRAIVERVIHLSSQANHLGKDLSALAVLTYTQKAAQDMYERACKALSATQQSPISLKKAFFGTIHSFCLSLIQDYGVYIGMPPNVEVLPPHEDLWEAFIQSLASWESFLSPPHLEHLSSFLKLSDYSWLAKDYPPEAFPELNLSQLSSLKAPDLSALLHFTGDKRNQAQVQAGQALVQSWKTAREQGQFPSGLPSFTKGGKAFQELYVQSFQPLKTGLSHYLCCFLKNLALGYRRFRLSKRKLTYEDLVYYATQLLKEPSSAALLKTKSYVLLLDEAQDTDPAQFQLLLGLVGLWDVKKNALGSEKARGGAFCMVGDPQQSIYSERASLAFYAALHEKLISIGALEELKFTTTLRCEKAIVKSINTIFPSILSSKAIGQVDFVPLHPAEHKAAGRMCMWQAPYKERGGENEDFKSEALFIAEKLVTSPPSLNHWGDLAILCPRKQWLLEIGEALEAYGLPIQLHSGQKTLGEDPAYAWFTALCTVLERPTDAFELTGILRELYGLEDAAIARYIKKFYHKDSLHPLNLIAPPQDTSAVFQSLASLKHLRETIQGCSLAEAFQPILKHTCLEERLASLPLQAREAVGFSLEQLYLEAKKADLKQYSLGEFAHTLRQGLRETGPEVAPLHNHIQLYTCHKAKGLEFEVVLLPFLSRKISRAPIAYPALYKVGDQTQFLLDTSQMTPELKDLERSYCDAELARLLYVSFTRAKAELILIDSASPYGPASPSFAEFLDLRLLEGLCDKD